MSSNEEVWSSYLKYVVKNTVYLMQRCTSYIQKKKMRLFLKQVKFLRRPTTFFMYSIFHLSICFIQFSLFETNEHLLGRAKNHELKTFGELVFTRISYCLIRNNSNFQSFREVYYTDDLENILTRDSVGKCWFRSFIVVNTLETTSYSVPVSRISY